MYASVQVCVMCYLEQVFDISTKQEQVYEDVSALVTSVLDGFNVCIFAYGQTGSGKTWTMSGPADNRGVNTRALEDLFERVGEGSTATCCIHCHPFGFFPGEGAVRGVV